ncbi:MAG: hypothetical protein BAA00_18350 [Parageobacillus thermoglucosidasius]|nr:AIR synthase-related protein [Parageobacillus thermoglucosidasius]OUM87527.1 MAG: hypothetical protein BAA00_18350 [Parageobacillus thermoglucosidasius]
MKRTFAFWGGAGVILLILSVTVSLSLGSAQLSLADVWGVLLSRLPVAGHIAEGGFAVALAECVMSTDGLGAKVTVDGDMTAQLFSETQSRFIVSVKKEDRETFEQLVDAKLIGEVTNDGMLLVEKGDGEVVIRLSAAQMRNVWKGAIPCLLKSKD